ncbi:Bardet-Biedl syndrome 12 protein homolog isoform X2 [Oscarella lobularis]
MNRSVGGGCTTLVNMISFWANPIAELVRKGVAVPVLNALLEDALLECIGALNDESYALDISEWVSISPPLFTSSECDKVMGMGSSVGMHDSRAISGHASGIRNEDDKDSRDDDDDFTFEEPDSKEKERVLRLRPEIVSFASTFTSKRFRLEQWEDLADFSRLLSHGKTNEMDLLLRSMIHDKSNKFLSFDADRIRCRSVVGGCGAERAGLVARGLVFSSTDGHVPSPIPSAPTNLLIVLGDITARFRHAGYIGEGKQWTSAKDFQQSNQSWESSWLARIRVAVRDTNAGLIVCHGRIDSVVIDVCAECGVTALCGVESAQIGALAEATGATRLTYLHLAKPEHVGRAVTLGVVWSTTINKARRGEREEFLISVTPETRTRQCLVPRGTTKCRCREIRTIVLFAPTNDLARIAQARFESCVERMRSVLRSRRVLPGGGAIELCCAARLRNFRSRGDGELNDDRRHVYEAVAEGLEAYAATVRLGIARDSDSVSVQDATRATWAGTSHTTDERKLDAIDDYVAKVEGWERALGVVRVCLHAELGTFESL